MHQVHFSPDVNSYLKQIGKDRYENKIRKMGWNYNLEILLCLIIAHSGEIQGQEEEEAIYT